MTSFYEQPILNSPYAPPSLHHPLDDYGQPVEGAPLEGRRSSRFIVPVPASRKKASAAQASLDLETYAPNAKVNEIRQYVAAWRLLPNPSDWGVTSVTQRLLEHWRRPGGVWVDQQPFFCQLEAAETIIWLTEVAPRRAATKGLLDQLVNDNQEANPELFRLAMKMATGSGKTTVMAMLIAWQAINAGRKETKDFSRGFLIVAPGITIKDRLRVLQPSEPGNYYDTREIVPPDLLLEIRRAEIVITNYHAFQHREKLSLPKVARAFLQGNDPEPVVTIESDAEMLARACEPLLRFDRVNVINDEAHHCYRQKVSNEGEEKLSGDERKEAEQNEEAARLWINGIEALDRQLKKSRRGGGVRVVYDLSATPFFLRGSGYHEGTLFPWVVSDFSLMDAIESGIVKLPRVPVSDNLVGTDTVVYRELWKHIGKSLPKSAAGASKLSSFGLPPLLVTALNTLYSHYAEEFEQWRKAGIGIPPVFIVVCQNTAISKLVFEWIAGFERVGGEEDERDHFHAGNLELFRNYDDYGARLAKPRTLLIDSRQLEAGEALDKSFRDAAASEIEQFRREMAARQGAGSVKGEVTESDLLREVMNTVGREGRLGEQIRCVVSVSMLTEGWDANTVTHILGVRAFGTQLLCEQVVGRGLRRQSYELNAETGLFDVEYADIMGIPFDFASAPQKVIPKPPKQLTRVHTVQGREALEIRFPRVSGYRRELPKEQLSATFDDDSRLVITRDDIGPTSVVMAGIVGEGVTITPTILENMRPSEISFNLAKHLLYTHFRDEDGFPKQHLFPQIQRLARRWIDEGYLVLTDKVPIGAILYQEQLARAAAKIDIACTRGGGGKIIAVLDPYNPSGSTAHVNFTTSKECRPTGSTPPKSQISHVVKDSGWEFALAATLEDHPKVETYAKNQALGFEIPYLDGGVMRRYVPDFLAKLNCDGEIIHLVLEMKGQRDESDKAKAQTTKEMWVPGVNALGGYGRWAFAEFLDPYTTDSEFEGLVKNLLNSVSGSQSSGSGK